MRRLGSNRGKIPCSLLGNRSGMVLFFSLWVLGVLTILAVSVAAGIRQKIFLIGRLDERSRMSYLLEAAVKKTAGYIHQQMETTSFQLTPVVKANLLNNSGVLSSTLLNSDQAGVGYVPVDSDNNSVHWGVVDEESKINLNSTSQGILTSVLMEVLNFKQEDADKLAVSLLDWRQMGEGEVTGFFSDEYYTNLQYPYPKKSARYETLDEMLLVKGMNKKIYDKLLDYVTIYGDGGININTASKEVLSAVGLNDVLIDKILTVRRGKDGLDATGDDHFFQRTYEITADISQAVPLTLDETRAIDALNMRGVFTTDSYFYTIRATGKLASRSTLRSVLAVYAAREDKIIYWNDR